jgi:3'-5' exoribonuclease
MKSPYVSDLQPNQQVQAIFLVQSKEVRQKKTGDPYLSLHLSDKTGDLEAKMWDNVVEVVDSFERDDFIRVKGLTQIYQNRLQLTIHKLIRMEDRDVDFTDYFPASLRDPDEMLAELSQIVADVKDADLRRMLQAFLADEEIARRLKVAPQFFPTRAKHVDAPYSTR